MPQISDPVCEDLVCDVVQTAGSDHVLYSAKCSLDERDVRVDNSLSQRLDLLSDPRKENEARPQVCREPDEAESHCVFFELVPLNKLWADDIK